MMHSIQGKLLKMAFLLGGLFVQSEVIAQYYRIESFSNREGFSQNTVTAIGEDKYGSLWIGTSNGLIKYDGYDFFNYFWEPGSANSIRSSTIDGIISDERGLLWIITRSGLEIFDPGKESFHHLPNDSLININRLRILDRNSTWIMGDGFLAIMTANYVNDSLTLQLSSNLLSYLPYPLNVNDILELEQNIILMATDKGLYQFELLWPGSAELTSVRIEQVDFPEIPVERLVMFDGAIWVGTQQGLIKTFMEGRRLHILEQYVNDETDKNSIPSNRITDLLVGNTGELWIGTWLGGLSKYNQEGNNFNNFTYDSRKQSGITSSIVNCLYEDKFGVIWIGTGQGGLCKLDQFQKKFYNLYHDAYNPSSIPGNLVNDILEDSKGYLWVATYRESLCRSTQPINDENLPELSFHRYNTWFNSYQEKNILSLFEDRFGYIWLGYENSVVVLDPVTGVFLELGFREGELTVPVTSVYNITAIEDSKLLIAGNSLIILNNPWKQLLKGDFSNIQVESVYDDLSTMPIASILVEKNRLWCGTWSGGLYLFEMDQKEIRLLQSYKSTSKKVNSNIIIFTCLHSGQGDHFLAGTFGGGLVSVSRPSIDSFSVSHQIIKGNLLSNVVYGILQENDSTLWLSTDLGILRYYTGSNQVNSYNVNDGLPSNNFRINAFHKGSSGYFYFGGLDGITAFRPDHINDNPVPPQVKLVNLKINNNKILPGKKYNRRIILDKPVQESDELMLYPGDRSITFDILVEHSSSPSKNRLAYMMEGFDDEWTHVNSGKHSLTYMNLPPGNYTMKMVGFNRDRLQSEKSAELKLIVVKPWYIRWWSLSLFVFVIALSGTAVFYYLIKLEKLRHSVLFEQKEKQRIEQVNQAKLIFFTNISHEFKTPLTLITAPLQVLMEMVIPGEQKKYLNIIDRNIQRLNFLITQLLSFRKAEQGKLDLKLTRTTLGDFVYPVAEAFDSLSQEKDIFFEYKIGDPSTEIVADPRELEKVIYNLLSNAFKFTPAKGKVSLEGMVDYHNNRNCVKIIVTDNGIGIQEDKLDKIFERFYQVDSGFNNSGAGIGLSYSKSIVELHKGYIEVESIPNVRTSFSVYIPICNSTESKVVETKTIGRNDEDWLEIEELNISSISDHKNLPAQKETSIMIIEDEVEIRIFLHDLLCNEYNVIESGNGQDALKKLEDHTPDMIISDVMMPGISGFDLCKKIKSEIETCHIPVILLTALGDMKEQIQGKEYGADAYIAKPFNVKYLLASITELFENRIRIQEHFAKTPLLSPDLKISMKDKKLIRRLNEIIENHLDNSGFGVEELSKELGFSYSQLYQKMKLFTGQTPNAYIRNYRLQRAADRIRKDPWINIQTVMFDVGIESASYFSHSFKKTFGDTPKDYAKKLI
jgi:signal transduction histidine kinase/DNA-binding response OmpR family regulator/ligand-binding sensor domain-containing protein